MQPLVIAGVACILAAIVGGGFKGLGVEIPLIGSFRRQLVLALAGGLLVLTPLAAAFWHGRYSVDPEKDLEVGLDLYDGSNYQEALVHVRRASRSHLAAATYHYGEMLYHGEGVVPNKSEGMRLDRIAAEAGFAPAEAALAMAYLNGDQLPVDSGEARRWASLGAAQHDPVGQYVNALLQDTPRERRAALELSAQAGYAPAQIALGLSLLAVKNTKGLPSLSTAITALKWIKRAADQGDPYAQVSMATVLAWLHDGEQALRWLLIADRAPLLPFRPLSDSLQLGALHLRDSLESALLPGAVLAIRDSALAWQPNRERQYRHGH